MSAQWARDRPLGSSVATLTLPSGPTSSPPARLTAHRLAGTRPIDDGNQHVRATGHPAQGQAQGLYDPRFEHDACGVAFVATLTGVPSRTIVDQALTALRNLDHRGAAGAEVNSGDGAGILIQVPDAFLREVVDFELPPHHSYAVGTGYFAGDADDVTKSRQLLEEIAAEEGLQVLGWRDVPVQADVLGLDRPQRDADVRAGLRGRGRFADLRDGAGTAGVLSAQAGREGGRRLLPVALRAHARLQGDADHRPARPLLPGPGRRADRLGTGGRALAVLDQHVPELAAGPPVPLHRPQRRDQHRDGQPQLDAGPRGAPRLRPDPGRPRPALPDLHAGRVRLRVVRRGPRAAAHGRALAAARRADDDPGGVGEPHRDGRQAAGVLRVPLHPDGAVGRPGLRGVQRRQPDRRRARPQRPAPFALLGDRRRTRRAGLRGRRPRHRPVHDRAQGPAPARPDVPRRHRRAPHHRGRGDQVRARGRASVRRVAARRARAPRRRARARAHRAHPRLGHPAAADLRVHRGGAAHPAHSDGQHRRRADRLDGHRLARSRR